MVLARDVEEVSAPTARRTVEALLNEIPFAAGDHVDATARDTSLANKTRARLLAALKILDLLRFVLDPEVTGDSSPEPKEWRGNSNLPHSLQGMPNPSSNHDVMGCSGPELRAGPVRLNLDTVDVFVDNLPIRLTPAQFKILALLVANGGSTVRKDAISRELWGTEHAPTPYLIKLHMNNLRRRLGDTGAQSRIIATVRGFGYEMVA